MTRSRRFEKMTDEAILELAAVKQPDKDRYYLIQELEVRGIKGKLQSKKLADLKESKGSRSLFVKVGFVVFLVFMLSRFVGRLIGDW